MLVGVVHTRKELGSWNLDIEENSINKIQEHLEPITAIFKFFNFTIFFTANNPRWTISYIIGTFLLIIFNFNL